MIPLYQVDDYIKGLVAKMNIQYIWFIYIISFNGFIFETLIDICTC